MSKATTAEEKLAAQVVAEAESAKPFTQGATGLATPKETVTLTITPILKEKNEEGKHLSLPPQNIPFDRPKGTNDTATAIKAYYDLYQLGLMAYTDSDTGDQVIYPLDLFHHYRIKVGHVSGITL